MRPIRIFRCASNAPLCSKSIIDLAAGPIFFVVHLRLFSPGDMAPIAAGVESLLGSNAAVFGMQIGCPPAGEFAISSLSTDTTKLIVQPAINFGPPWMVTGPWCSIGGVSRAKSGHCKSHCEKNCTFHLKLHC
jgi:hypothetical protein